MTNLPRSHTQLGNGSQYRNLRLAGVKEPYSHSYLLLHSLFTSRQYGTVGKGLDSRAKLHRFKPRVCCSTPRPAGKCEGLVPSIIFDNKYRLPKDRAEG